MAVVKVGPFSRHGESRVAVQACDHDFQPEETLTPWGIFLPGLDDLYLYFTRSKVTSDFIVDTLGAWWEQNRLCPVKRKRATLESDLPRVIWMK